jgi:hypothetical protein
MALTKVTNSLISGALINVLDYGAVGDGIANDTVAIQAAHTTGKSVFYPDGTYLLTDEISLSSNASVVLSAGVIIEQTTDNKSVFKATTQTNIDLQCNNALFKGYGAWSASWTGNSGHLDRVIAIINCITVNITNARTRNGSNAGLYIEGSVGVMVENITVEGTHNYGVPIPSEANFQNGIYIKHSSVHGNCKNVQINNFNVTGTAQGILAEVYTGYVQGNSDNIVLNGVVHGIPGQHGAYLQSGNVNLSIVATDCELDGCKIQAAATPNPDIKNFILDVNATNCGSHALEIQNAGDTGVASISNIVANVVSRNCQRGLGINKDTSNMQATVVAEDSTQHGLIIQGTNNKDIDVDIVTTRSGRYGVYVDSVSATDITIRPKVREANTSSGAFSGININSVGSLTLINPEATDSSSLQDYGLYVVAGDVWVKGKAVFTGTSTVYSARANVLLKDWPVDVTLDSTSSVSLQNIGNFGYSTGTNKQTAQTTSATDVTMYQIPLDDESSVSIVADIACKLSDTTKRRYVRTAVLAYRDGGGATLEAAATTLSDIKTAGDTSAFTWEVNGNDLRLRVNSGATATYDWQGEFEIIRI